MEQFTEITYRLNGEEASGRLPSWPDIRNGHLTAEDIDGDDTVDCFRGVRLVGSPVQPLSEAGDLLEITMTHLDGGADGPDSNPYYTASVGHSPIVITRIL